MKNFNNNQIINEIEQMIFIYNINTNTITLKNDYCLTHMTNDYLDKLISLIDFNEEKNEIMSLDISVRVFPLQNSEYVVVGKQIKDQILKELSFDYLTELPTMNYFYNYAEMLINDKHDNYKFAVLYFNISNFKRYNEKYSYKQGDKILTYIAELFNENINSYITSRFAKDHFVMLINPDEIMDTIKYIKEEVENFDQYLSKNVKIGIYELKDNDYSIIRACDKAKTACDMIRHVSNKYYLFFNDKVEKQIAKKTYIIEQIDEAIAKDNIKVYYQSIKRVLSDKVCGAEALVRWNHPVLGLLSPAEFIPILESNRLIYKIDQFVVEKVCQDLAKIKKMNMVQMPVSVNFSRLDFQLFDIVEFLNKTCNKYDIDHSLIHVEITESALNGDITQLKATCEEIRENGYEIWLDDFGSEYSTFNTLHQFDFDTLKIDMKFFKQFETNEKSKEIVKCIVNMAKNINLKVVAEGIETLNQYNFLKEIGCDKVQGYLFYKPSTFENNIIENSQVETEEERHYFDQLAKVNIIGKMPLKDNLININWDLYSTPLALVEFKGNQSRLLLNNEEYNKTLRSININSKEESNIFFNSLDSKFNLKLLELANKAIKTNAEQTLDINYQGQLINVKIIKLATYEDRTTFLISMVNLSTISNIEKLNVLTHAVDNLYMIYNRIDLVNIDKVEINNVYLNTAKFNVYFKGNTIEEALNNFKNSTIHQDDHALFDNYYNLKTINQRLDESNTEYLTNFFRTKTINNEYVWQMYLLLRIIYKEENYYLSCIRNIDIDEDSMNEYINKGRKK